MIRFMAEDLRNILKMIFDMDWNKGENRKFIENKRNRYNKTNGSTSIDDLIQEMSEIVIDKPFGNFCEFCEKKIQ